MSESTFGCILRMKIRLLNCVTIATAVTLSGIHLTANAQASSSLDCLIEPWETIDMSFADQGVISSINVEVSQTVKKGDVLASLDSGAEIASVKLREFQADRTEEINAATALQQFDRRNLERVQTLYKKKSIPFRELDEAETAALISSKKLLLAKENKSQAELELALAQQILARRTIYSPLTGIVIKRHKSVGEYLEGDSVLTLAQMNPLRVHVLMPVAQFGRIKAGMKAQIVPEEPLSRFGAKATVVIVDQIVDVASGTFGVQLELNNDSGEIPGGLKCTAEFLNP